MKSFLLLFLLPLICGNTLLAQADKSPAHFSQEVTPLENTDRIKLWLQNHNIPALGIGVIEMGKLQSVNTYGVLDDNKTAPHNTIFNVASLTKPVVGVLALKLADMGKLDLDEPLYPYWVDPDIKNNPWHRELTPRIILSHQTGFPNWRSPEGLAFEFAPGTKYQYSGEGFEYLKLALDNKFSQPIEHLADSLLFGQTGMKDTRFYWDNTVDERRFAVAHDEKGQVYEIGKNRKASGADDLLTTIEDYGMFLVSLMDKEIIGDEIFNEMISPQVKVKKQKFFGLGWERYELENGDYALSHGGADKGVHTLVFLLPKSKQGLLIFTNSDNGYKVYEELILHHLGDTGKQLIDIETGKEN